VNQRPLVGCNIMLLLKNNPQVVILLSPPAASAKFVELKQICAEDLKEAWRSKK
jgi:hypothetical protein